MINKVFGKTLRQIRQEKGLSQDQLSQIANMQRNYLSFLERGIKSPSLNTIYILTTALNIDLGEMMQRVDAELKRQQQVVIFIYGLQDPSTKKFHYVGQSQHPKRRFTGHLSEARRFPNSHKCLWIADLLTRQLQPMLIILEETNGAQAQIREAFWIVEMMKRQQPITNQSVNWREIKQFGFDANTGLIQLTLPLLQESV